MLHIASRNAIMYTECIIHLIYCKVRVIGEMSNFCQKVRFFFRFLSYSMGHLYACTADFRVQPLTNIVKGLWSVYKYIKKNVYYWFFSFVQRNEIQSKRKDYARPLIFLRPRPEEHLRLRRHRYSAERTPNNWQSITQIKVWKKMILSAFVHVTLTDW